MTQPLRTRRRRHRPRARLAIAALIACGLLLFSIGTVWTIAASRESTPDSNLSDLTWPAAGAAALALGDSIAVSPGGEEPRPIASLTKLVTALVVLDTAPLAPGEQGPSFAMDETDAQWARSEVERGGGSVPVNPGEVLTERQLLEYVLIASSNNHATTLVSRIFGDEHAYLAAARHWLDESGLPDVQIADASGMSPDNRASARDLLEIGRLAAEQPVIAELTAQPSTLSTRGDLLTNTNDLLGTLDISGLKTGYTRAAGHTVLFTAPAGGHEQLIGVLLGSPSTAQRATDVTRLIAQVRALVAG